jgi:hypothetical protein
MNPEDVSERGLKTGQIVDITSHFDDGKRHANHFIIVPYDIPKGCAATYFPEANVLVPIDSTADRSNTPVSKFVRITVAASELKNGESEIVGKFDYDYVKGYAPVSGNLTRQAKPSFLSKISFQNVVGAAMWITIVGAVAKNIYKSEFK